MSTVSFQIRFDNPNATYFNGQHVEGDVVIELLKEKKFRGIQLFFSGGTRVHWSERRGNSTHFYSAEEFYLGNVINLVGDQTTDTTLPPGKYTYPFRLILPTGIPSSYESVNGRVRYSVKAVMSCPWGFDYKCKAYYTVLNPLDLNNEPNTLEPIETTTEKKLWFGMGSPMTVDISVPFTGYVPGQQCRGTFKIDNPTANGIKVKARLVQVVTYISTKNHRKTDMKVVCREKIGHLKPYGSMESSFNLQVPALPDSHLNYCSYIDISYYIEIKGSISGMHRNLYATVPIVIESIPSKTQFVCMTSWKSQCPLSESNYEHSSVLKQMEADLQESLPEACAMPDAFFPYPDMPPPTYEECVTDQINIKKEEDDEDVPGVMTYAPRYPVYSFKENDS